MSTQNQKPVSQDYYDGMAQIFKVIEIHLNSGKLTHEAFQQEKDAYLGLPVAPPSKESIELIEIRRNKQELDEFTNSCVIIPDAIKAVKDALATIGLDVIPLKTTL